MSKEDTLAAFNKAMMQGEDPDASLGSFISKGLGVDAREDLRRGTGESLLIGTGRAFTKAGQAVKQMALSAGESMGAFDEGTASSYTQRIADEASIYNSTPVAQSISGFIGENIIGPAAMAAPIAAAAPAFAATSRGAAAIAGAEGALEPVMNINSAGVFSPDRLQNVALYALAGAGFQKAIDLVPAVSRTIKEKSQLVGNTVRTSSRALEGIEKEAVKEATEAAAALKTFVTPAEASGDLLAKQREANLQLFGKAKRRLLDDVNAREATLQGSINTIVRGLVPEGTEAAQATAKEYAEKAYATPFPLMSDLLEESELLRAAHKKVNSGANKDLLRRSGGGIAIQPNTVGELHTMRMVLDDMIETGEASTKGVRDAKKLLVGIADTFAPEYAISRNINQRLIIQRNWQKQLDKTKDGTRASSNFYTKYLASEDSKNELLRDVDNIIDPAVRKNITDNINTIAPLLRSIHKSPLDEALGLSRNPEFRAAGIGGFRGVFANLVSNILGGTIDKQMTQFITSPSWVDKFKKASNGKSSAAKNRLFLQTFQDYLYRVSPAVAASMVSPEPDKQMLKTIVTQSDSRNTRTLDNLLASGKADAFAKANPEVFETLQKAAQ
jgi:hypothetical protein